MNQAINCEATVTFQFSSESCYTIGSQLLKIEEEEQAEIPLTNRV